jgi:cytochrome c peroxidase
MKFRSLAIDLITSKLAALQYYQLSIPAPIPEEKIYDFESPKRGKVIFEGKAKCISCHVPPNESYRTTTLKGLLFYHDGRFATYRAVVDHYDNAKKLALNETEKKHLVE